MTSANRSLRNPEKSTGGGPLWMILGGFHRDYSTASRASLLGSHRKRRCRKLSAFLINDVKQCINELAASGVVSGASARLHSAITCCTHVVSQPFSCAPPRPHGLARDRRIYLMSEAEIRQFLLHQMEVKHLSYAAYQQIHAALKFLYHRRRRER
jgi:hypothetical protein